MRLLVLLAALSMPVVAWIAERGVFAVYVKQSQSSLPGAQIAAWTALGIGTVLVIQCVLMWTRQKTRHRGQFEQDARPTAT